MLVLSTITSSLLIQFPQKKTHTHLPLQKCIQRGIHRNKDNLFMKNIAVFSGEKSLENGPLAEK